MSIFQKIKSKITIPKLNLALVIILAAFVAYTLFAPITPAVYSKPVVQDSSSLYAGHTLTYHIHSCRHVGDGVVTTITRQLVSLDNKQLQPINLSTDVITNAARCQTSTKTLIIPYSTPEGKYYLLIRGIYAVIPLRKPITVTTQSDTLFVHGTSINQEIQDLIDANSVLQGQLQTQAPANGSRTTTTQNKNGSSTTSTNTNNTTTTNSAPQATTQSRTTPATTPAPAPSNSSSNNGLIQGVIKSIGGGLNISL